MIRLALASEPYWLADLPGGVRVRVRPLDMPVYQAALGATREFMREQAAKPVVENEAPEIDLTDKNFRDAMFKARFAFELARYGIIEWEGVLPPTGNEPAEVNPDNIARFVRIAALGSEFYEKYSASILLLVAEGNA